MISSVCNDTVFNLKYCFDSCILSCMGELKQPRKSSGIGLYTSPSLLMTFVHWYDCHDSQVSIVSTNLVSTELTNLALIPALIKCTFFILHWIGNQKTFFQPSYRQLMIIIDELISKSSTPSSSVYLKSVPPENLHFSFIVNISKLTVFAMN